MINYRRDFKSGKTPILISTHISGRGIDISNVAHVINYDLPSGMGGGIDEYVHRIGRTGRIGHTGLATSFYNESNEDLAPGIVNLLLETGQKIPDFLEHFKPEDGLAKFDDNSDEEEGAAEDGYAADAGGDAGDAGGWGEAEAPAAAADDAGAWGVAPAAPAAELSGW